MTTHKTKTMEKYELWETGKAKTDSRLFVRSDHNGDRLRAKLPEDAKITWEVEAEDFFHAMTAYWEHMGRGVYTTADHIFPGEELNLEPEETELDEGSA